MNIVLKIKKLIKQILGALPSQVPQGLAEFEAWMASIIEIYTPPGNDRSIRFVLSSLLMRLGPSEAYKSKLYFANSLKRAAASQVAVYIQEVIKEQQRAEAAAQLAEVPAPQAPASEQVPN